MLHNAKVDVAETQIEEKKLVEFLNVIARGYRTDVQYHNDLHGADVAQMVFMFTKMGNLRERIALTDMDFITMLIAAACHDYDHDGFNNAYHVNSMTHRAVRYHDEAVQENYHASESISLMLKKDYSFLEDLEYD